MDFPHELEDREQPWPHLRAHRRGHEPRTIQWSADSSPRANHCVSLLSQRSIEGGVVVVLAPGGAVC